MTREYNYGTKTTGRRIHITDEDIQSVRDFTKAYRPENPGKFADWLMKKYPRWRGARDVLIRVIEDQLKRMRGDDAA